MKTLSTCRLGEYRLDATYIIAISAVLDDGNQDVL